MSIQTMNNQRGFTLLEFLVVLAIVIIIISLALPSYHRSMARSQFKAGVVELQSELLRTRLLAMKTGTTYLFRFRPSSSDYEIIPKEVFQKRHKEQSQHLGLAVDLTSPVSLERYERQTFGQVIFGRGIVSTPFSANLSAEEKIFRGDEENLGLSSFTDDVTGSSWSGSLLAPFGQQDEPLSDWSEPILFYPNGRTSQAVFLLKSSGEWTWYSEIVLRGMTGTARISAISIYPPESPLFPSALTNEQLAQLHTEGTSTSFPLEETSLREQPALIDANGFPSASSL